MFHYLRDKPRILVTGLMRSGTTICSEMIAHDTGHRAVREEILEATCPAMLLRPVVLQAPVLLRQALELRAKQWFIVVMVRDFEECFASTAKMLENMLPSDKIPNLRENLLKDKQFLDMFIDSDMAPMVVRYENLKSHPLWVEDRKGWSARQTKDGPVYRAEMDPL